MFNINIDHRETTSFRNDIEETNRAICHPLIWLNSDIGKIAKSITLPNKSQFCVLKQKQENNKN